MEGKKKTSIEAVQRAILPKMASALENPASHPRISLFERDQEEFCFRHFCNTTSSLLSGPFKSDLWRRLIPQACEVNPSIRHAVVAIASLDMISGQCGSNSVVPTGDRMNEEQTQKYHRFALQQYSKALQYMLTATTHGSQDVRTALLTCLVIICFEAFYGDLDSALAQLQAGLGLLNKWSDEISSNETKDTAACSRKIEPCAIEDELIRTYARLDINDKLLCDPRYIRKYSTSIDSALGDTLLPQFFTTVEQSRIYLGIIHGRVHRFYQSYSPETFIHEHYMLSEVPTIGAGFLRAQDQTERDEIITLLIEWNIAFDPILQLVRISPDTPDFCAAMTLQLHYLTTYYIASCLPSNMPTCRRDFMSVFAEILSISRSIINHPKTGDTKFTFDAQIVKPLYTVACECPSSVLRRQAIALLLAKPRREGLWDAVLSAKIAEWVMGVEEEDVENGYVSDDARIRDLKVKANLQARRVSVECMKPEKDGLGRMKLRRAVITW
jgi:hypothetical protein